MKKKIAFLLALTLVLSMVFCSCGSDSGKDPDPTPQPSGGDEVIGEISGLLEGPVMIVAIGQSADISIAKSLMTKVGVEYAEYTEGANFEGYKSVMLVPGVSVKGLGSAGIDVDTEIEATKALLGKIDEAGLKVIVAHLGGSSRRDELSDQFIDLVLPEADCICALAEGNKDGKFSDFAKSNNTPCAVAKDVSSLVTLVSNIYGK